MHAKTESARSRPAVYLGAMALMAVSLPALAHDDHVAVLALGSLASGLLHPFSGLAHMLLLPTLGFAAMRLLARPLARTGLVLLALLASWLSHAAHVPMDVAIPVYQAGFLAATLLVIASGMVLGMGQRLQPVRLAGVTITLSSLYLLGA